MFISSSDNANVKKIWGMSPSARTRRIRKCCSSTPTANKTGMETNSDSNGSTPKMLARKKLIYMPIIRNSPWAKLTIFTTPKISVTPMLTSASAPPPVSGFDQLGAGFVLGKDGGQIAMLPLHADRMGVNVLAVGTEFHLAAGAHCGVTGRDVERGDGVAHFLWIGRCGALKRVGNHECLRNKAAGIFEQELAKLLLIGGIDLLRVVVDVVVPVRHAEQPLCGVADVSVEIRNDEATGATIDGDLQIDLFDCANDQNEIVEVGDREQHVGAGRLDLVDQRTGIAQARRVRLEHHDFHALGRRLLAQSVRSGRPEGGVLEYDGDLRLIAHELRHLQLCRGELGRATERREREMMILVELIRA